MASRVHLLASKIHKWIALVVGLQFLAWTMGGLVMSWLPIELVRGEANRAGEQRVALDQDQLVRVTSAVDHVSALRGRLVGDRLVAEIMHEDGRVSLLDAQTATLLSPINGAMAQALADADFIGEGKAIKAVLLEAEPGDYRGSLPVWQVHMDDADNTRIYVTPNDGRVRARRNDYWRFYDFFWMLHIMDYKERENFNNPLIMIAALSATLFALSGFVLVYHRFNRRDFGLKAKRR